MSGARFEDDGRVLSDFTAEVLVAVRSVHPPQPFDPTLTLLRGSAAAQSDGIDIGRSALAEFVELAAVPLRRAARSRVAEERLHVWFARRSGRAVIDVAIGGEGGPDTFLDDAHDLDISLQTMNPGVDPVADLHGVGRFGLVAVDLDVAAVARVGRIRPRLENADRPQELVDTG